MTRKYEFTGEEKQILGRTLKRIRRISDGLVGGWIEKEYNLSHDGACFVFDNACISDNARVSGNASVSGYARVYANARVFDNARVYDYAWVFGKALVYGNACVFDNARIYGKARVHGKARVLGDACISDNAVVTDNACISDNASVYDNTSVFGNARVSDNTRVSGDAHVFGDMVCTQDAMYARLYRYTITCSDSHISVGCKAHTFDFWKEHGERIAKEDGFSDDEIELYKSIVLGMIAYREATNQKG